MDLFERTAAVAPSLKRFVLLLGCVLLAGAIIPGCAGEGEYPVWPAKVSAFEVVTVVDDIVLYRDFDGFDDGHGGFDLHDAASVPIYAKRVGADSAPVKLFENLPDESCGSWMISPDFVLPAPAIMGEPGAGAVRIVLVSQLGCVRVVDLDIEAGTVDTVAELPGDGTVVRIVLLNDEPRLLLGGPDPEPFQYEVRIIEFEASGLREVQTAVVPELAFVFDLGTDGYVGAFGYSGDAFHMTPSGTGAWSVDELPNEDLNPCFRGASAYLSSPRGSEKLLLLSTRMVPVNWSHYETVRVGCEDIELPEASHDAMAGGWVRRDTGEVYLRLTTGVIIKREGTGNDARWVDAFEVPEEFQAFLYGEEGYARSGQTHAEGEFWFSRGKDRIALMRVDLDGDDAPEWEWLVDE